MWGSQSKIWKSLRLDIQRRKNTSRVIAPPKNKKRSWLHFLWRNNDEFACSHEDMPRIDPSVIVHRLNVDPSHQPVKQRRSFASERNQDIAEEVKKLLQARLIKEVDYPEWLPNVVLVKKSNGKWRMCIDFTNLNKAYLKDSFPLPRIDLLVDSTSRHEPQLHGCLLRIQLDTHERGKSGENILHYQSGILLLQNDVVWLKKCQSHISKVSKQNVSRSNRQEC
jgi:hypothetical protein